MSPRERPGAVGGCTGPRPRAPGKRSSRKSSSFSQMLFSGYATVRHGQHALRRTVDVHASNVADATLNVGAPRPKTRRHLPQRLLARRSTRHRQSEALASSRPTIPMPSLPKQDPRRALLRFDGDLGPRVAPKRHGWRSTNAQRRGIEAADRRRRRRRRRGGERQGLFA